MPKHFANPADISGDTIVLRGADAEHLRVSLRAAPGDEAFVSDGAGTEHRCEVVSAGKSEVRLRVLEKWPNNTEPRIKAVIYQGIPKGGKLETVAQKCVELGVFEIVPMPTERTVGGLSPSKLARLDSVCEAAAKQSMRGIIPRIRPVADLKDAIADSARLDAAFVAYEDEKGLGIRSHLRSLNPEIGSIGVFIGPEGGFSQNEICLLEQAGIKSVSLGPRILRAETAPLAALSCVFYEFGCL
jgi:16S rRNA (uracil1498-N3)-methyltransferase